ncbi:hypothetical protein ACXR0O_15710 [Verrucomicrobiota bacterium sgz303538]
MIFHTLGSDSGGGRTPKDGATPNLTSHSPPHDQEMPDRASLGCAISGPALLQTEQVLLRRAPEFVPIIQQIRRSGAITVQSGDPDLHGTYNLYRVSTSQEGCKMIADALARALEAQRGHPASLRVLVNIWQDLERQMC